jgi:Zn-dependent peptidase ImmA (M78 family)
MDPFSRQLGRWVERKYATRSGKAAARYEVLQRSRALFSTVAETFPPTDLGALARHVGVDSIRCLPLAVDGRLVSENGRYVIEVNKDHQIERQRFTIAHEIAHLVIAGPGFLGCSTISSRSGPLSATDSVEEQLCNYAAAELLIPSEWVRSFLQDVEPRFPAIAQMARTCAVSLEVAARQLTEAGPWRCRMLWWRREGEGFKAFRAFPAYDPRTLATISLVDPEHSTVAKVAQRRKPHSGKETLMVEGEACEYSVEVWSAGAGTVAMLLLFDQPKGPPRRTPDPRLF